MSQCKPCDCGDCDQSRSDNSFYTKQLHERAAKALGLDGENTSWFEIVDVMEKELDSLRKYEKAYKVWSKNTKWIQGVLKPHMLKRQALESKR
jgi:hypothetical protein